jgi:hypothetical protein
VLAVAVAAAGDPAAVASVGSVGAAFVGVVKVLLAGLALGLLKEKRFPDRDKVPDCTSGSACLSSSSSAAPASVSDFIDGSGASMSSDRPKEPMDRMLAPGLVGVVAVAVAVAEAAAAAVADPGAQLPDPLEGLALGRLRESWREGSSMNCSWG